MFTHHDMKISKPEVAIVASVIVLPLLFDWIPFTTNSYGQHATWCWIRILEQNCTTNSAGQWEQIWLWNVPFGMASFMILTLFVGSLCQLGYGIKNAKVHRLIQVGTVVYLLFLSSFVFATFLYVIGVISTRILYLLDFKFCDLSTHWSFCPTWSVSGYLSTHLCNLYIIPQVTSVPRDRQSSS